LNPGSPSAGRSRLSAWISSAAPTTAVERVGQAMTEDLRRDPDFRKVFFNKPSGWLEEQTDGSAPERLAKGFTKLGKSAFQLSLKRALPEYGASFVDCQNLAFLAPPRACLFVYDVFYLTHPNSKAEYLQGRILYRNVRSYELIMTDSHYTREVLIDRKMADADRIKVVHLDVDRKMFRPDPVDRPRLWRDIGLPEGTRMVLHVSSGEKRKNFPRVLEAFAALAKDMPDVVLVKAGKDLSPQNQPLAEARARELGIADRVRFLGRVDDARLTELYRGADCFVFPSLAEGFGLPVLEAQACGCPVVTANVTSLPEVSGPLCKAVDPLDSKAIALAIAGVLGEPGIRARLADANRAFLGGFSWEPGRKLLKDFFDSHRR
jgi:glycosyltransferase involved in cell wall biosynthesis